MASSRKGGRAVVADDLDRRVAWSGDRVRVDIAVSGNLPPTAWSADVTIELSGQLTYRSGVDLRTPVG